MNDNVEKPRGELSLRSLAMPADTNPAGDIFGGWLLSQMDIAGGLMSKQHARGRTVTIAINGMTFHKPVFVGDVVCCYTDIERTGRTSMEVRVQAWVVRGAHAGERLKVTEGLFTYVAVDDDRNPRPIAQE
jgi:acyl-CoA thioesterase YciA